MPYGQPIIKKDYILCEECGECKKKLTHNHLKLHGLTIAQYKEKWGLCRTQPLEALYIKKIRQQVVATYKSHLNIVNNPKSKPFKKGENNRNGRQPRAQELGRLLKMSQENRLNEEIKLKHKKRAFSQKRDPKTKKFIK